jgi:hypothetical protein
VLVIDPPWREQGGCRMRLCSARSICAATGHDVPCSLSIHRGGRRLSGTWSDADREMAARSKRGEENRRERKAGGRGRGRREKEL